MVGLVVSSIIPGKQRTLRVLITNGFHNLRCALVNNGLEVEILNDQYNKPSGGSGKVVIAYQS